MNIKDFQAKTLRNTDELCAALQIDFSAEQLAAICAPLEPGVVIAGAGSGKTTVMAARVVWLVGTRQVRPDQVLGLTFTRKAAAELANRIRDSLERGRVLSPDSDQGQEVVMTYDAFAARLIAEHGLRMGLETNPSIITGASRYRLAARVVKAATGPFSAIPKFRPQTVIERVLKLDSGLSSHLIDPHQVRIHAAKFANELERAPLNNRRNVYASVKKAKSILAERLELLSLVDCYAKLKTELGISEFADQLAAAARLVDTAPSVGQLVREQFKVVLLDEYQDTSSAQAQLLFGLFGGGHPVTAVGDPMQAIYGWRGAAASNITSFANQFVKTNNEPANQYQLSVNRRSEQAILDVANEIGDNLGSNQQLSAPAGKTSGVVVALGLETAEKELNWIAESIADQGRDPDNDWSQTAILVRRNADIGPLFSALVERDVPVEIVGLGGLLQVPEVATVVSTLSVLNDVTANSDVISLLSGPRWRIGAKDLQILGNRAKEISNQDHPRQGNDLLSDLDQILSDIDPAERFCLFDAATDLGDIPISAQARSRLQLFVAEITKLNRHIHEPVLDLVRRVVAVLGIEVELAASQTDNNRNGTAQLMAFYDAVSEYVDTDGDASLDGLLAYLQAETEYGIGLDQAVPSEQNSVKLLTIHKAKGLEWDRVYLPGLADKVFPTDRGADDYITSAAVVPAPLRGDAGSIPQLTQVSDNGFRDYREALKEDQNRSEDRLAYVAVTRAKKVLIGSWHLWSPGLKNHRKPSVYFQA
ncbi:MAG: ATP-dependent DNA helicase, partial [Actinomycetales bacterium]